MPPILIKFHRSWAIAWLTCCALSSASVASLQFTFTNLAPAGSISFLPSFFPLSAQVVANIMIVSVDNAIPDILPQLTFLGGAEELFPFAGGGFFFPELLPGDILSFSLENVDLAPEGALDRGSALFGQVPLTDGSGSFIGADYMLTTRGIAEFDSSGAVPFLILPNSGTPGPESITPSTQMPGISVISESSVTLRGVTGFVLFMRRRRSL